MVAQLLPWSCPVCGCCLDIAEQELNHKFFMLYTCWNEACPVFGRTCSQVDLSDPVTLRLWETKPIFDPMTGRKLDTPHCVEVGAWCMTHTVIKLVGRFYSTYQIVKAGDPLDVNKLIRDEDGHIIWFHDHQSVVDFYKRLVTAAAADWASTFEVSM